MTQEPSEQIDTLRWITPLEALKILSTIMDEEDAKSAIIERSKVGLVYAHTELWVDCNQRWHRETCLLHDEWDQERGAAVVGDWRSRDFHTLLNGTVLSKMFGVRFDRVGIEDFITTPIISTAPPVRPKTSGGRPRAKEWNDWIAELAKYVDLNGLPPGVGREKADEIIKDIEDGLANRGLEGPSRSTVQPAVWAVIDRFREAPETDVK